MTDAIRLLVIAIGVAVNAVVWFRYGRYVEQASQLRAAMKRADEDHWNTMRQRCNDTIAQIEQATAVEQSVVDQMNRQMEFYREAFEVVNCKGGHG